MGRTVFDNLLRMGFHGPVYPVNPHAESVGSVHAYPSIDAIPGPVDLAILLLPAPLVLEAAKQCGDKGVRALVVISAGFGETPGPGREREEALLEVVRHYGMRMVGPNCLGVINTDPTIALNATFAPSAPPPGDVAFSSQSGALGVAIIDQANALGIGISEFVSVGNKADINAADLLTHWSEDARTRVVLLYLEGFGDAEAFAKAARALSAKKPVVAVKSGRTGAGARAASSHTGSLATPDRAVEALLRHTGIVRTDTVEELFETAMLLAHQPLPAGRRVAIVTNAGGPGILATDACVAQGLEIAALDEATKDQLRRALPAEASVENPVDMIASAGPDTIEACMRAVLDDANVDAVMALFVPPGQADTEGVAAAIVKASDDHPDKPVLTCFMGAHGVPEALRSLQRAHVPSYAFPEAGARALARVAEYAAWLDRSESEIPSFDDVDREIARHALQSAEAGEWLDTVEAANLLRAYGISVVETRFVETRAEARQAPSTSEVPWC